MRFIKSGWKDVIPKNIGSKTVSAIGENIGIMRVIDYNFTGTGGNGRFCEMRSGSNAYNTYFNPWVGQNSGLDGAGDSHIVMESDIFMQEFACQMKSGGRTYTNSYVTNCYDRFHLVSEDNTILGTFNIYDNSTVERNSATTSDYFGIFIRRYGEDDFLVSSASYDKDNDVWLLSSLNLSNTGYNKFKLRWEMEGTVTGSNAVAEPGGGMANPPIYMYNPVYKEL